MKTKYKVDGGCVLCLMCVYECPVGAISIIENESTKIDSENASDAADAIKTARPVPS